MSDDNLCDECGEPLPDDPAIIEFGRHPVCDQTAIARGAHELEASGFREQMRCKLCDRPITWGEICADCEHEHDPFYTSKYRGDYEP